MNADERRFVKSLASLPDHIVSPYALCAACLHVPRLGEARRGGGGVVERGGGGECWQVHISFISPHFFIVPKPRETDLPIPK